MQNSLSLLIKLNKKEIKNQALSIDKSILTHPEYDNDFLQTSERRK